MPLTRRSRRVLYGLLGLPVLAGMILIGDSFVEDDNFHKVDPTFFRSGQLRSDEWSESLAEQGYRSVLNLRGPNPGKAWYETELQFAADHDLAHYDVPLSAKVMPTNAEMEQIVDIMRSAPKPLLVHCNSGSDRTGLVAALYVYSIQGASAAQAADQLSVWFGHLPWINGSAAMDQALARFVLDHPLEVTSVPSPHFEGRRWPT